MTNDLHAGRDYTLSQAWADALHRAGHRGMSGEVRHDVTGRARKITLFAAAGPRSRLVGWRSRLSRPESDKVLATELAPFGTGVPAVPFTVQVTHPPL